MHDPDMVRRPQAEAAPPQDPTSRWAPETQVYVFLALLFAIVASTWVLMGFLRDRLMLRCDLCPAVDVHLSVVSSLRTATGWRVTFACPDCMD